MKKNIMIITFLTLLFLSISSVFAFQFLGKSEINYEEILKSNDHLGWYWSHELCEKVKGERIKEFCIFEKNGEIYIKQAKIDYKRLNQSYPISIEKIKNYNGIKKLAQILEKYDVISDISDNKLKWKYNNCISNNHEIKIIPGLLGIRNYDWKQIETKIDIEHNNCLIKNHKGKKFYIDLDFAGDFMLAIYQIEKTGEERLKELEDLSFQFYNKRKGLIGHY